MTISAKRNVRTATRATKAPAPTPAPKFRVTSEPAKPLLPGEAFAIGVHARKAFEAKRAKAPAPKPIKGSWTTKARKASAKPMTPGQKALATKRANGLDFSAVARKAHETMRLRREAAAKAAAKLARAQARAAKLAPKARNARA